MSARPYPVRTVARAPTSQTATIAHAQLNTTGSTVRQVK